MRSSFAPRAGLQLLRTPSHRQQVARRRLMVVCAMLGLALAAGVVGSITAPGSDPADAAPRTGPFSYFPSE